MLIIYIMVAHNLLALQLLKHIAVSIGGIKGRGQGKRPPDGQVDHQQSAFSHADLTCWR